jgi:O-antigen chain-terminating methyltransferase
MTPEDKEQTTGAVDVAALLREVDQAVEDKKAAGFYDPAEVRRVEELAVSFGQAAEDDDVAEANFRLVRLQGLWDICQSGIAPYRGGMAGRLELGVKQLIHRVTRPYINMILARQMTFNNELIRLLGVLVSNYSDMRYRLSTELDEIRRGSDARLSALERESGKDHAELEAFLARLEQVLARAEELGKLPEGEGGQAGEQRRHQRALGYLAFEDMHRGSPEEIQAALEDYLPYYQGVVSDEHPLVDLGCGRGEFLQLAKERGLAAKGVDLNPEMVALCREQGFDVGEAGATDYLRTLEDASLGGIMMAQLIEHLDQDQLTELVSLASAKLAPGGVLIAETINPQCLSTFASAFYLDLSHIKPIHPEAVRFLWRWAGLGQVEILYRSPVPLRDRLENLPGEGGLQGGELGILNRNMDRLNQLLFSFQDYAVIGRK